MTEAKIWVKKPCKMSPSPVDSSQLDVVEGVNLHEESLLRVKVKASHSERRVKLEIEDLRGVLWAKDRTSTQIYREWASVSVSECEGVSECEWVSETDSEYDYDWV